MRLLLALLLAAAAVHAGDLTEQLRSDDARLRHAAAEALGKKGDAARAALPALIETLTDPEPWVRVEAARAIVRIGLKPADLKPITARLKSAQHEVGTILTEAVAPLGEDAMPWLLETLEGKKSRVRRYALMVVRHMGRDGAECVPLLLGLLSDDDPATKKLAGEALRRSGPWAAEFVPEIVEQLRFGKPTTRVASARILALIGPAAKQAIPALRNLREEGDAALKQAAADALALIDVVKKDAKRHPALRRPELATLKAPDAFRVTFDTTQGAFTLEIQRAWAPHAADRFYNLVKIGFFDGTAFYRAVKGFVVQFGLHTDSRVNGVWANRTFDDDARKLSNVRGTISFARTADPKSRATQVFVNLTDNSNLDKSDFAPFGKVTAGLDVLEKLHTGYGDGPPYGAGPDQRAIISMGDAYLKRQFPRLDRIKTAKVVK